ncbi:hypothetical protein D3874_09485 [Oleomonas cavernae]|uniref:Uncharacterized protein n=1 Tax=Oleomonas cavernae TaxID=2320859 RepID=A0A418WB05_9PROT|nr:hypothetical protein [Oleomonas cavernae]RJF87233.1 hypothetical protein D3874_09485 [Oleomonas cavernae]
MADDIIKFIKAAQAKHSAKAGAICLMGYSSGCFVALAVAAKLKASGFGRLAYIGLGDLPIFPLGRQPAVANGVGQVIPRNDPSFVLPGGGKPEVMKFPVDAVILKNYYQTAGNGPIKPFARKPNGTRGWWWASGMLYGEVHGMILEWDNVRAEVLAGIDKLSHFGPLARLALADQCHIQFCKGYCPGQFRTDATAAMLDYIRANP